MEDIETDTNAAPEESCTPREETPYQKRVKRRMHFSAQKLRENERKYDGDTTRIKRKLNYSANKATRISTPKSREPTKYNHLKIKDNEEYNVTDTNHDWRVKNHEDYMVVDCRNYSEVQDKSGEMIKQTADDLTDENEELVDDINDIKLSSEDTTEDDWSEGVDYAR